MNKSDNLKIKNHALYFLKEWAKLIEYGKQSSNNTLDQHRFKREEKQLCCDVLQSLKYHGFIKDFKLPDTIEL